MFSDKFTLLEVHSPLEEIILFLPREATFLHTKRCTTLGVYHHSSFSVSKKFHSITTPSNTLLREMEVYYIQPYFSRSNSSCEISRRNRKNPKNGRFFSYLNFFEKKKCTTPGVYFLLELRKNGCTWYGEKERYLG